MTENKEFLYSYLNAYSPVGQEGEGQKIWMDYVKQLSDKMEVDSYGTAWGILFSDKISGHAGKSSAKKVVIEAHCDEIAWIIQYIDKDGNIRVAKHGGSDAAIAPSKKVVIHTRKNGKVPGVFGFPAIHTRKTVEEKVLKPEELFIDCGVDSKKELEELGVEVGNLVTFSDTFDEMGDYYVGKSLDNKIGGYIIAEVLRKLRENNISLPYDLYVVNSVQEEVGLHGARMVANRIKPDVAFVHDVCHHTNTPGISKTKNGDVSCGEGPALEHTAQNHRKLIELIRDVADANKIKYQLEVGSYGNDTMGFFLGNGGIPTTIIATPLKYMHTTVESAHKRDVEAAIELFYQTLIAFDPNKSLSYQEGF